MKMLVLLIALAQIPTNALAQVQEPDSRVVTNQSAKGYSLAVARLCLSWGESPLDKLDDYAKRHALTPAEKDRLGDDCRIAFAAGILAIMNQNKTSDR